MDSHATTEHQESVPWTWHDVGMVCASIVCLILLLNIGLLLSLKEGLLVEGKGSSLLTLLLFIIQELFFVLPLYVLVIRKYKLKLDAFGLKNIGIKKTLLWVAKGFGLVFLFNIFLIILTWRFGGDLPGFKGQESHVPLFGGSPLDIVIAVVVLVIVAPIIEELIFRGFLLKSFLSRFPAWLSSVAVAAIFAAVHFEFQSSGIIFVLALIMNWMFIQSRSLWPSIIFHIVNNGLAFWLEWLVWTGKISM